MTLRLAELGGTPRNDTFSASGSSILFGHGGNDAFTIAPGSLFQAVLGGNGNDSYSIGTGSTVFVRDTGGEDTVYFPGMSFANSVSALIDGKHLGAVDTVTGAAGVILDWASGLAIENIYMFDALVTDAFLRANLHALPGFLGNVSWEDSGLLGGFSAAEMREAISFYTAREAELAQIAAQVSPGFDPGYYFTANPDVAAVGVDPSSHYFYYGQAEGRNPNAHFSEAAYRQANPDVAAAVAVGALPSGYMHYLLYGAGEGRSSGDDYQEAGYLAANPDVAAAVDAGVFHSGFEHFVLYGAAEGRHD